MDRAFVDYFNIFQSLPVFGQHVIYNFIEREFSYEPPIRKKRNDYIDRKEVAQWLCVERFPGFSKSCLFLEYILCSKIRDVDIDIHSEDIEDPADRVNFTRNVLGNALGMQLFRDSLKGTQGEKCYTCWLHLERVRRMPNGKERSRLNLYIRYMYLASGAAYELESSGKHAVFEGKLNFELIPEAVLQDQLIEHVSSGRVVHRVNTIQAYHDLQRLILAALRTYWIPRYFLNLVKTIPKRFMTVLIRGKPFDNPALSEHKQMPCRIKFSNIYGSTSTIPPTSAARVVQPNVEGELIALGVTSQFSISDKSSSSLESVEEQYTIKASDILTISGGNSLEPFEKEKTSQSNDTTCLEMDSHELQKQTILQSISTSEIRSHSYTKIPPTLNILPSLSLHISGRRRITSDRKISSRVMCALVSDKLAGNPLQSFLCRRGQDKEKKLFEFWTDIRQYLDADDGHRDEVGNPIKQKLANMILNRYLSSSTISGELFSEKIKLMVNRNLSERDDDAILNFEQEFVTENLKNTWKKFMATETRIFQRTVCRENDYAMDDHPGNMKRDLLGDPLVFCKTPKDVRTQMSSGDYGPTNRAMSLQDRPCSRSSELFPVTLTDEQIMKAFDFTIILAEYGRTGMFRYQTPTIADIADAIVSDYGSLHINPMPVVRNHFLHKLMNKQKLDIANLKVSRRVCSPTLYIEQVENEENVTDETPVERPPKPRSFMEVLSYISGLQYEGFKRFMAEQNMPYPLAFWSDMQKFRALPIGASRLNMMKQIFRTYFSKSAQQGLILDCTDDIISQISTMDKVPVSALILAQGRVYKVMERKWYPKYLETFPEEVIEEKTVIDPNEQEQLQLNKMKMRKKAMHRWRNIVSTMIQFLKCIKAEEELELLEIYLKRKVQKEPVKAKKQNADKNPRVTSSTSIIQSRPVVKNRVVVVDKLPADLGFWCEILKYVDQVDHIENLEHVSTESMDFLNLKATHIINHYLASEIPPRNQVNISNEVAQNIITTLEAEGPGRGLFHDAQMILYPLIYSYWRKCKKEWLSYHTAAEVMALIKNNEMERSSTPHKYEEVPDFMRVRCSQIKITNQVMTDDELFIINFSLRHGFNLILPHHEGESRKQCTMKECPLQRGAISDKKAKRKEKDKSKFKSKHSSKKKKISKAEEDLKYGNKSSMIQPRDVDELIAESISKLPSRLKNVHADDLISASLQDDIDRELFN